MSTIEIIDQDYNKMCIVSGLDAVTAKKIWGCLNYEEPMLEVEQTQSADTSEPSFDQPTL